MFRVNKDSLQKSLEVMRQKVCCYFPGTTCDCKYSANPNLGQYTGEGTGCCELRLASLIFAKMTEEEYETICNRK